MHKPHPPRMLRKVVKPDFSAKLHCFDVVFYKNLGILTALTSYVRNIRRVFKAEIC
jgi:hypothetical protein